MRFRSLLLALGCAVAVSLPALADGETGAPQAVPVEEGASPAGAAGPVEAEAAGAVEVGEATDADAADALEPVEEPLEAALAPEGAEADATGESDLSWEDFEDSPPGEASEEGAALDESAAVEGQEDAAAVARPDAEAPAEAEPLAEAAASAAAPARSHTVQLGPIGYDDDGRQGRLHTVARGDTLWDISAAYLGTPWVWPSVWIENDEIENPHRIDPGDLIWITSNEMRRVTPQEADQLLSASPADAELASGEVPAFESAADADFDDAGLATVEVPIARNELPVSVPLQGAGKRDSGRTIRVSNREHMSFISSEALAASSSIVESPEPQVWLTDGDLVYIGLGEGEVEVGDHYTIFRDAEEVRDVGNESLLGYHVKVLGWAEVKQVHPETATAEIRISVNEIHRGDRVLPRQTPPPDVTVREAPDGLFGRIVFLPDNRTTMGSVDYVYLNLGSIHGLEVGTALEVYDPGRVRTDNVRYNTVQTPDHEKAQLVVVSLKPDSAVAFVLHAGEELQVGDVVKGADSI